MSRKLSLRSCLLGFYWWDVASPGPGGFAGTADARSVKFSPAGSCGKSGNWYGGRVSNRRPVVTRILRRMIKDR